MKHEVGIILICYGTASKEVKEQSIDRIEQEMRNTFPGCWIRCAFISQYIINKLRMLDGIQIFSFEESLKCAIEDGVENLIIQQLYLSKGYVAHQEAEILEKYKTFFKHIAIGKRLLADDEDIQKVAAIITSDIEQYRDQKTAVCFIGHGTVGHSNVDYLKLQEVLYLRGNEECFVGMLHGAPSMEEVLKKVKKKKYRRIVFVPLMLTAGHHTKKNIAGENKNSWKSRFELEGYEVVCMPYGLGENIKIRKLFTEHTQNAMGKLF